MLRGLHLHDHGLISEGLYIFLAIELGDEINTKTWSKYWIVTTAPLRHCSLWGIQLAILQSNRNNQTFQDRRSRSFVLCSFESQCQS